MVRWGPMLQAGGEVGPRFGHAEGTALVYEVPSVLLSFFLPPAVMMLGARSRLQPRGFPSAAFCGLLEEQLQRETIGQACF